MIDAGQTIQGLMHGNQVFTGMAGAAVVGTVMMQARALPGKLLKLTEQQFTVSMTIHSEDRAFRHLSFWLSKQPFAKKARTMKVVEFYDDTIEDYRTELTAGEGNFIMWEGKRPFLINRVSKEDKGTFGYEAKRKEDLTITTFGRSPQPLHDMLEKVRAVFEDNDRVPVYTWSGGGYRLVERRLKRDIDSVYLPDEQKAEIIAQLKAFLDGRKWYQDRFIPWRKGFSFEGPPGTGKTSLIFALASLFNKSVYLVSPSNIVSDASLQEALNSAGAGFVVIEDIDAFKIAEQRKPGDPDVVRAKLTPADGSPAVAGTSTAGQPDRPKEEEKTGLTTSGLLNAIDGIAACEGRALFITSNHADKLDAALMRPGRIDYRTILGPIGMTEALKMHARFFPEGDVEAFKTEIEPLLPITPAALQNRLLGWDVEAGKALTADESVSALAA